MAMLRHWTEEPELARQRHLPIEGEEYDKLHWERLSLERFGHRIGYDHEVISMARFWSDIASRVRAKAERKAFWGKSSAQFHHSPSLA
jgi:hypothetical protein